MSINTGGLMSVAVKSRPGLAARKTNPFSIKVAKSVQRHQNANIYETLSQRCKPLNSPPEREMIQGAINNLKARLNGQRYTQEHFGKLEYVSLSDFVINIDNQRDVDWDHVKHIIETFDPRIAQPANGIVIRSENGNISVPEGQHTLIVFYLLYKANLLPKDFKVQCKVIDESQKVPGSQLTGEAFGNLLFRIINYKGRKGIEPYYMHRSRYHGVRKYGSTLLEDIQAERIESCIDVNTMITRPAIEARGRGATPGMVTYITGLNRIAELESPNFDEAINDLNYALELHDKYFPYEKGVDGGFILALGRYAKVARESKIEITSEHTKELMKFFKHTYASPGKFHTTCKNRLRAFQKKYDLHQSWSDSCLNPILIMDFHVWCEKKNLDYPIVPDKDAGKYVEI